MISNFEMRSDFQSHKSDFTRVIHVILYGQKWFFTSKVVFFPPIRWKRLHGDFENLEITSQLVYPTGGGALY